MDALTRERWPDVDLRHEARPDLWPLPIRRLPDLLSPRDVARHRRALHEAMDDDAAA